MGEGVCVMLCYAVLPAGSGESGGLGQLGTEQLGQLVGCFAGMGGESWLSQASSDPAASMRLKERWLKRCGWGGTSGCPADGLSGCSSSDQQLEQTLRDFVRIKSVSRRREGELPGELQA